MDASKNPLVARLHQVYKYCISHKKEFLIGLVFALGVIVLGVGYGFYRSGLQKRAHKSFVQALKVYNANVHVDGKNDESFDLDFFTSEEEKWTKVAKVFKEAYQSNKSAGIAPIFLAYQSEALVNLGNLPEAIAVLKSSISMLKEGAIKSGYKVKLFLMQLDSGSEEVVKSGLNSLKDIALDQNNEVNDMALFYLGQHYWFAKNFSEAKNYWNQLTLKYGKASKSASWWAQQAKQKLKLISA